MIFIPIGCCVLLLVAFITLLVIFFGAKKNFVSGADSYIATISRISSEYVATKAKMEVINKVLESLPEERKSAEEMLERAVMYEEKFKELSSIYGKMALENDGLLEMVEKWKKEAGKQLSHRKSIEVRTGLLTENMAPILDDFPYDFKTARFLGNPLDYVCFCESGEDEGIHFVEVKSGDSQLSTKQRKLKQLIEDGKVSFEVYRLKK